MNPLTPQEVRLTVQRLEKLDPYGQTTEPVSRVLHLARMAETSLQLEGDQKNALGLIRMRGVPENRAKHLSHALDVLLTRLDREIQAQQRDLSSLRTELERLREGVRTAIQHLDENAEPHEETAITVQDWLASLLENNDA